MIRTKRVNPGGWRTLEWFFGGSGTAFFDAPARARIKVRFGVGWFGFDRQSQTLDGRPFKRLAVGLSSFGRARFQIAVTETTDVTYQIFPGNILDSPPPPPNF
jgi:hypothetical protein